MSENKSQKSRSKRPVSNGESTTTEDGYVVPAGEETSFHVELETPSYDPFTGQKKSVPFVQKYSVRQFALAIGIDDGGAPVYSRLGYVMNRILWQPADELLKGIVGEKAGKKVPITELLEINQKHIDHNRKSRGL